MRVEAESTPLKQSLARSALLHFRADDPHLVADADGRVVLWPNRCRAAFGRQAGSTLEAVPPGSMLRSTVISKTVLRFDGRSLLEAPRRVPPIGSCVRRLPDREDG